MKKCTICEIEKEYSEFGKHSSRKDGLTDNCKVCRKTISRKDYLNRQDIIKKQRANYYLNNKDAVRACQISYQKKRIKYDQSFKLSRNLRNRLYYALLNKGWKKNCHFSDYIGCDYNQLMNHLSKQFIDNMSWDNYGEWHIDHIVPLSSAKTEEEMYKLCHYSNLQPLWAVENIKKGSRF